MSLRTKTVGIIATVALSLTMTAGIASADTAGGTTTVTLADPVTPVGCTISATGGSATNFGTLNWSGTTYTGTTTDGSVTLLLNTDRAPGNRACPAVMVQGTGLTNVTPVTAFPAAAIGVGAVTGLSGTDQTLIAATASVAVGGNTSNQTVALDESQVNPAAPAGVYNGTITFTVGAGL
jgi:hypothetical protein